VNIVQNKMLLLKIKEKEARPQRGRPASEARGRNQQTPNQIDSSNQPTNHPTHMQRTTVK
jgi:hypothetical protein